MLKQGLYQKQLQRLSPLQIQTIKLLELPTLQLEQRIKKELEENPVLEEGSETDLLNQEGETETVDDSVQDEFTLEDYLNEEDETPNYKLHINNNSPDEKREYSTLSSRTTLHQHLLEQLDFSSLSEHQRTLGAFLIGSLDDDGYLRRDLQSISDDLAFKLNVECSTKELEEMLTIIQTFDPFGVGARNLQECLLIQLRERKQQTPDTQLAEKILTKYFDEFSKKHYEKIKSGLNITDEKLKNVIGEILKLTPKPGNNYTESYIEVNQQITPDFIIENKDGQLILSLNNQNIPELRINSEYAGLLQSYAANSGEIGRKERDTVTFVKQKLESAKWFIESIKQRQNTLMLTMQAIVDYQKNFFLEGDESYLRPMNLKTIAEKVNLDISTISRVANSKYVQTPFGTYSLKYFFSEGMQTESGDEVSTREIKKILSECIENENKRTPYTDEQLMEILNGKGYPIARRTVAKYREQLDYPVARLRKEL